MPLALDPNARTTIYLKSDMERPPEQRVGFLCRFITMRQREEHKNKMADACREDTPAEDTYRLLMEAIAIGVIGPVGVVGVPCTAAGIEQVLTASELWDLAWQYPHALAMDEMDKKKSASDSQPSTTDSAKAKDAPPANAENVLL